MQRLFPFFLALLLGFCASAPQALADSAKKSYDKGYKRHMQGNYRSAIDHYSKAIDRRSEYVQAYQMRAAAWHSINDHKRAAKDYSKVIQLGKTSFRAVGHFNRGVVYYDSGRYVDAIVDFTSALSLDHRMGMAYLFRGIAKSKIGDRKGQVEDFALAARYGDFEIREMLEKHAPHTLKK